MVIKALSVKKAICNHASLIKRKFVPPMDGQHEICIPILWWTTVICEIFKPAFKCF